MDIKVKDIGVKEEKSLSQKVEEELLDKHAKQKMLKNKCSVVEQVDTSNESATPHKSKKVYKESETQENITLLGVIRGRCS